MFNSDVKLPEGICHILNRNVQEKTSSSKELYFANGTVRKIRSWRIFPDHQRKTRGFLYHHLENVMGIRQIMSSRENPKFCA